MGVISKLQSLPKGSKLSYPFYWYSLSQSLSKLLSAIVFGLVLAVGLWVSYDQGYTVNAADFSSFSVFRQDGSSRLLLYAANNDFDTTIQALQYNIGRGWVDTTPTLGTSYFDYSIYTEILFTDLPIHVTDIDFRLVDSDYNIFNLTNYLYAGDELGCELVDCFIGTQAQINYGSDSNINYQYHYNAYLGDGVPGDNLVVNSEFDGDDGLLVALVHYRSNDFQVSSVRHVYTNFQFGCRGKSSEYTTEIWYMTGPDWGVNDVEISWTGMVDDAVASVTSFSGVNQVIPAAQVVCNQDGGWAATHSLGASATTDQVVMGGATTYSGNFNDISGTGFDNELFNLREGNVTVSDGYKAGAGGVTMLQWENTDPGNSWPWSAAAMVINPVPLSDSTDPVFNFTETPAAVNDGDFSVTGTITEDNIYIHSVIMILTNNTTVSTSEIIAPTDGYRDELAEDFTQAFNLIDGDYTLEVRGYNTDGYYATETFNFDVLSDDVLPVVTVSNFGQTPTTDTTPSWTGTATDNVAVSSVEYKVYDVDGGVDEIGWTAVDVTSGSYGTTSVGFGFTSPSLTDGVKEMQVRAIDSGGNTFSFTVDRVVIDAVDASEPILRVKDLFPNPSPDPEPRFTGKVLDNTDERTSNITNIYYRIGVGSWIAITPLDGAADEPIEEFQVTLTGLGLGDHSITFRGVDAAGNDTNIEGTNVTKNFTLIAQPGGLTAQNYSRTLDFDSDSFLDFDQSENLIWGNGRLRLAEQMDPVGTPLITSTTDFGPKYGSSIGSWQIERSATNGFWVTKSNGLFAYYSFDSDTETEFDLFDYYGNNQVAYDIEEVVSGGNYHIWVAAGNSVFGMNLGNSITDGSGDSWVIRENPGGADTTNLIEIQRDTTYGVFYNMENGLNYLHTPAFTNAINNTIPVVTRGVGDGYIAGDITSLFADEANDEIWYGDYTSGVSKLNHGGTPETIEGGEVVAVYASQIGTFDIGKDKDNNPFFIGNRGVEVVTANGGTYGNSADDTVVNVADNLDLNSSAGAVGAYLAGTFPVESQYFVANRTGEMYYVSTNGTYADSYDDQLIRLPLTDIYPTSVRDFYMVDEDHMVVVLEKIGVYIYDLGRLFKEQGYATTDIDAQVANYLHADFIKLDGFTRIDGTDAVVTYKATNTAGTTVFTLSPGATLDLPADDYRVAFRIDMFRGSTPVLTAVTFSYSAYPDAAPEMDDISVTGLPSNITTGQGFNFDISTLDQLDNPFPSNDLATIELRRSSDNGLVSFSHADAQLTDGEASVTTASANVVGNHYLVITVGSVTYTSPAITFVAVVTPPPPPPPPSNTGNTGGGFLNQVAQQATLPETESEEEEEIVEESEVPEILEFEVVETMEDGQVKLTITWDVANADYVEISGVGENLPARGRIEIFVDSDTVIQILGIGSEGDEAFDNYRVSGVAERIAAAAQQPAAADAPILPLLVLVLAVGGVFIMELASSGNIFLIPAFYFRGNRDYSGVVFDSTERVGMGGVKVQLYKGTKVVAESTSDVKGRYLLEAANGGEGLSLRVANPGYAPYQETVSLKADGYVRSDIVLQRLPQTEAPWQYNKPSLLSAVQLVSLISLVVGVLWGLIVMFTSFSIPALLVTGVYLIWLVAMLSSNGGKRV